MKKSYIRFFLIMAVLIAVGLMLSGREVRADDIEGENEEYSWQIYQHQNYNSVYIYTKKDLVYLKVPSKIDGYNVKEVNLSNEKNIENIEFEEGITKITCLGEHEYNSNLKNIKFPNSVKNIYWGNVCTKLEKIEFPEGVEVIRGFRSSGIKSVKFPNSVKKIDGFDKTPLETIEFPEGVEEIGGFEGTSIKSVKIPNSVKKIDGFARTPLETIEFPEGVEEIFGFGGTSIKSVKFPNSVKYIGGFSEIPLETIEFPENVETIMGFSYCDKLETVKLPQVVDAVYGFDNCKNLKGVKIPEYVKIINGFNGCENLETIEFPELVEGMSVKNIIGFNKCKNLKSIKIPEYVKNIKGFNDCENLGNIELSEGIEVIIGFFNTACKNFIVPSSVKLIYINNVTDDGYGKVYICNNIYFLGKNTNIGYCNYNYDEAEEYFSLIYSMLCSDGSEKNNYYSSLKMISDMEENMKEWNINISEDGKEQVRDFFSNYNSKLGKPNIYCYEDSIVANLKKDFPDYFNIQYITSDTKIPIDSGSNSEQTTKYTTLPLTTINNQLYAKGINPESNTVEQIIKSGKFAEGTTVKVYKYGQEIANSEKVGTGSVIKVLENGEVKEEYIVVVYGDTDGDGEITSIDALAIVKNKTGKIPFTTEAQKEAARLLTKTGTSGAVDALAIVKSRTGKAVINQENGTVSKK